VVGEESGVGEAWYRWHSRPSAGGDDRLREAQLEPVDLDGVGTGETCFAEVDVDAVVLRKPTSRVVRRDVGPNSPHPRHHPSEVDLQLARGVNAEDARVADFRRCAPRADHRLRRDAAHVEAISPEQMPLDEGDLCTHPAGAGRSHQTGSASADHDQVVSALRLRVLPIGRVDVCEQFSIVLVIWCELEAGVDHWGLLLVSSFDSGPAVVSLRG
jgi:hypothetical protein